jgi:Family of unknown function (DUF6526)
MPGVDMTEPQSFANHARIYPLFHFFVAPVLILNLLYTIYRIIRQPSFDTVWALILAASLLGLATAARLMALTVQDRVIRLEMRLRLIQLLPPALQARIGDLTHAQLIGLRFAGDGELPQLVQQVLDGSLKSAKEIKQAVKSWQGDYLRA